MAKSEKAAQKSKRDKSLQKTKAEPTYKSAQYIEDSSSASETPTPSRKETSVDSTSKTVSTPSTKGNLHNGSATKTEKHKGRKKSSGSGTVHSQGTRVEHEVASDEVASKEKDRVNGLCSTTEDTDGLGEERSKVRGGDKQSKSAVENAAPPTDIPSAEASTPGSPTSSDSEEEDVDVPPANTLVDSDDEGDELEYQGGMIGDQAKSRASSGRGESEEASERDHSGSSNGGESISKATPKPSAHPSRPLTAYQAPPDFEPAAISLGEVPNGENLFSPAGLKGKELWHVVLPSSVPISALKEIPAKSVLDGSNILSRDDSDYGLVPHTEANVRSLLIPSHADNLFTPVKTTFAKSLRLQQLVKVPSHAVNPELRASSSEVPRKKRTQQPQGLRMRYLPFGIPDSPSTGSGGEVGPSEHHVDSENYKTDASQFRAPPKPLNENSARKTEKKKKRKHAEIASSTPVTPSSSQLKKVKQEEHSNLDTTSPPMQSPTLVSSPISRPGNSQAIMQAKPEDLITITNASPMQLEQEGLDAPLAKSSPSKNHRHKLQSSPPVTPVQPKHDVPTSSNKDTNKKSHHKARKSEKNHRNKLLQPFHIPSSVSPALTPANRTAPDEDTPTAANDIMAPDVDAPAADLGANFANTDRLDDSQATAGASSQGFFQPPKKNKKKTHRPSAESLPLPSSLETATPLSGVVKVRDFVKASNVRLGEDVDTAAASKPFSNAKIKEAPSVGVDGSKGATKSSNSEAGPTPTAADIRIGERAVDASSPTDVNTSKDVIMQDVDSKYTDSPLDDAAERERRKQRKKALKEARRKTMGELKSDSIQSNGTGEVADTIASSPSLGVAKNTIVNEDSTMQNNSQLFEEEERARKKREKKERKRASIAAEVKPVQQASSGLESISTNVNHDTASNGHGETNLQLYEESERARKKKEKSQTKEEKSSTQAMSGEMSPNMSTSVTAAKDPMAHDYDAVPTTSQLYEETERARKKRAKRDRKDRSNQIKDAQQPTHTPTPTPTSAGQATAANEDTPAPTNSQLYHQGELARKKREEEQRLKSIKREGKPARPTSGGGGGEPTNQPASAPSAALLLNERVPASPPTTGAVANDPGLDADDDAARARRKQEKQARRDERRRLKAIKAATAAAAAANES